MLEIIGENVIKKLIDTAANVLQKKIDLSGQGAAISVDNKNSKEAISTHLYMISRWASEISFRDLRGSKALSNNFVDLDLTLGSIPYRRRRHSQEIKVTDLLSGETKNAIILGDPGAGKTTSLKRLALGVLREESNNGLKTPLLIRLRDINGNSILPEILSLLGIDIKFNENSSKEFQRKTYLRIIGQYLRNLKALLLVDGIDEISFAVKENIIIDLRDLILQSKGYQVIGTSRVADFRYSLENSLLLAVEPLSTVQIKSFAIKWLGEERGLDLLEKIRHTPYGGSEVLPLTLAHLCAIYERSGSIPEKPRTVYRKVVRLLLEEWDEQRLVKRESRYASFDIDRKEDLLKALAFHLTLNTRRSSFNQNDLEKAYRKIHQKFDLPKNEAKEVAREIESHTGLVVETGFEGYEFAHKSIQEYLAAEYILKLATIPANLCIALPNEMALATALSSDSTEYFFEVVSSVVNRSKGTLESFSYPFLRRILIEKVDFTSSRTLAEAVIALYSETYYPTSGQLRLPIEAGIDIFVDFLQQNSINKALMSILRKITLQHKEWGNTIHVPPLSSDEGLIKNIAYYTLDKRFFDILDGNFDTKGRSISNVFLIILKQENPISMKMKILNLITKNQETILSYIEIITVFMLSTKSPTVLACG